MRSANASLPALALSTSMAGCGSALSASAAAKAETLKPVKAQAPASPLVHSSASTEGAAPVTAETDAVTLIKREADGKTCRPHEVLTLANAETEQENGWCKTTGPESVSDLCVTVIHNPNLLSKETDVMADKPPAFLRYTPLVVLLSGVSAYAVVDPGQVQGLLNDALSHQVTQFTIAFSIAAWLHSGRVKKEIKNQLSGIATSLNGVATALRQDLQAQSTRLTNIEHGIGDIIVRVEKLENVKPKGST